MEEKKSWGVRIPQALSDVCQYDILKIDGGGYSSLHYHRHKFNQFIVESGQLNIVSLRNLDGEFVFVMDTLTDREQLTIPPGVHNVHQFYAIGPVVLHEWYWVESGPLLEIEDIVRLTDNGIGDYVGPSVSVTMTTIGMMEIAKSEEEWLLNHD